VSIDSVGGSVCVPSIPGLERKVGKRFAVGEVLLFVNFLRAGIMAIQSDKGRFGDGHVLC